MKSVNFFPLKIPHVFSTAIVLCNWGVIYHAFTDLNLLLGKTYILILKNTIEPYCHMNLMQIMEFFSLMYIWFFHHNHFVCLEN